MCRVRLPSTHVFVVRGGVHVPELSESDRCWRMASVAPSPAFWRIALVRCIPTARIATEGNSGGRK